MKELQRSLGAALLILITFLLTFKFKAVLGWSPDFIIPALAAVALFLDAYSLALFVMLAFWVMDWRAGSPPELWLVAIAPLLAKAGKNFLPLKPWVTLTAVIAVCEILFYIFAAGIFSSGGGVLRENLAFIISNIAFAVLFGLTLMKLLEWAYGRKE